MNGPVGEQDHQSVAAASGEALSSAAMEDERVPDAEQMSIARRLRQPRTIFSIAIPKCILVCQERLDI